MILIAITLQKPDYNFKLSYHIEWMGNLIMIILKGKPVFNQIYCFVNIVFVMFYGAKTARSTQYTSQMRLFICTHALIFWYKLGT